ncbi:F-box and associated interaction domains-containing protein [Striga asiatica]|uniref:F-box and associated interaction domains-containing protein n=1 Tax=Striga asiatica TaxID=4170 RepID=A0A5A7QAR8_STRAF|nr:F-box and associated interaction domains-containing protein [Striga asiatica]
MSGAIQIKGHIRTEHFCTHRLWLPWVDHKCEDTRPRSVPMCLEVVLPILKILKKAFVRPPNTWAQILPCIFTFVVNPWKPQPTDLQEREHVVLFVHSFARYTARMNSVSVVPPALYAQRATGHIYFLDSPATKVNSKFLKLHSNESVRPFTEWKTLLQQIDFDPTWLNH